MVWPYQSKLPEEKTISLHELSELVAYEELEQEANAGEAPVPFRRSVRAMHNFVPLNPFRATVRIHKSQASESYREDLVESESSVIGAENTGLDSPASFPPTPFSRAYVMNRASERVVSLMFAARDRLRLEAQSVSRDEYSRMVATEARTSGQYAVFDSRQTSNGIALTCGNHCAVKTGKGLCCSTRSMIAIHPNTYVYLELSITVSSAQVPTLGIGFTSTDCPLNVMVGSWPQSIGLYNDGQVLLGSHWYQTENQKKIEAGSTVGMLVYIPKQGSSIASTSHDEAIHLPNLEPSLAQSEITHPETTVTQLTVEENAFGGPSAINKGVVKFNINGEPIQLTAEVSKLTESLSTNENPFYPTVSLFSEDTRVWCRFCEADIVYRSRDSIQAPLGTRVYCLDGSLLLNEFQ